MQKIALIAHNLRSTHNVGSLLRTADGMGVDMVYLTGYTPYPTVPGDKRLPHVRAKIDTAINKTALGAEHSQSWAHSSDLPGLIDKLRGEGHEIVALEQTGDSVNLPGFRPARATAIIVGREVEGIEPEILKLCDTSVEIPMLGKKESLNVVQAAAIALYHCRFFT